MSTKLFVGNLSFNTTENDLQDAFAAHGTVVEANLMMDRMTGRPRGFGFVTMSSPEEAEKAIQALNGAQIDGRALTVNVARPREERPGGAGGGSRGGYGGGGGGGGSRGGYSGGGGGGGGGPPRTSQHPHPSKNDRARSPIPGRDSFASPSSGMPFRDPDTNNLFIKYMENPQSYR